MAITLGAIEIDDSLVFKQLKQDIRDDWFPDPRRFDDVFSQELIQSILKDNFELNHGAYRPTPRQPLNMPKANFTLRAALETSLSDRVMYHALVGGLVPLFDPLMPWQVFSHRCNQDGLDEKYLFKRGVPAWKSFTGVVRSKLMLNVEGPSTYALLSTDLTNYFDNIEIPKLKLGLEALLPQVEAAAPVKADARNRIDTLFRHLDSWSYKVGLGLPQNRDASSFLANVYMLGVDRAMLGKGYKYFRYMDDIKIVCDDVFEARKALKDLSIELREIGLCVNARKTVICEPGDIQKIDECLDQPNPEMVELDEVWATRKVNVIARSLPALRDFTLRLLREGKIDTREFRFCIGRLELLAMCEELAAPPAYFTEITPLVIEAFAKSPAATDQLAKFVRVVPTSDDELRVLADQLMDVRKSIYSWQNYRLWILLAQKKYRNDQLVDYAKAVVSTASDGPTRSGATMYLGSLGGLEDRRLIAGHFASLSSFSGQRHALIAMQELNYGDHIQGPVQPHVRADLKGVWRGLRSAGVYFAPPERRSLTWVVDGDRDYD